jgi:hypothetical protein
VQRRKKNGKRKEKRKWKKGGAAAARLSRSGTWRMALMDCQLGCPKAEGYGCNLFLFSKLFLFLFSFL